MYTYGDFIARRSVYGLGWLGLLLCLPAAAGPLVAAQTAQTTLHVSMTVLASCEARTADTPLTVEPGAVVCPPSHPFRAHWSQGVWRAGADSTAHVGPVFSGAQQLGRAPADRQGAGPANAVAVLTIAY